MSIPISSFEASFGIESLFEGLIAVLIKIGPFDGITEDFVGFCECIELLCGYCWVFLCGFGVVPEG